MHTNFVGLLCHCDICVDTNNTCVTKGFCFTTTSLQKETGIISRAYRCLDEALIHPPENPIMCHYANPLNDTFVINCCKDRDMCNKYLNPILHVRNKSAEETAKQ
ncbi:hypothetical protein L9F63_015608, partial [Diploptera punctata]